MKLYIIANRLPVRAVAHQNQYTFVRSEGGLTTGLDSLDTVGEKQWIGWPGVCVDDVAQQEDIRQQLATLNCHPIFLSEKQQEEYYEGYSNSTLWPLCHYFFSYTLVKKNFWEAYKAVNELFCDEICQCVKEDDWVWVQDYQLMLLPALLRQRMPHLHIGYFHHIPFPSYELFRILPERAELLQGILGADFISFHTHDYMRHFISAAERVLHVEFNLDETQIGARMVRVDALPMGINYPLYHQAIENPKVWQEVEKNRVLFGQHQLLLSVDRLDYSKGILHRLQAYSTFLERHPEYHGKVTLAMVIVPSRDKVERYADLKTKIDETIGAINGQYSTMNWTPVCYFYHGFSFEELTALYYVADIAMVTPLRDGMNLVAKEYVATKVHNPGVLILSERAGAAVEMTGALLINPNDVDQVANAIYKALKMPFNEQLRRMEKMQGVISRQTVNQWAADFLSEWKQEIEKNNYLQSKIITLNTTTQIGEAYAQAQHRLILLDYDGTLVPFQQRPEEAAPTTPLLCVIRDLCADPRNKVVVNSGRNAEILEKWMGCLPLDFAAEHGASYKEQGVWHHVATTPVWSEGLLSILRLFVAKTPGSHIETKATSLVWHYREADAWLGELRAQQLIRSLVSICLQRHLQILPGNKVVEIKSPEYNKGSEVKRLLNHRKEDYDFILAIGDDTTDNDMFLALPQNAITIKVGTASEIANYNLTDQSQTLPFLNTVMTAAKGEEKSPHKTVNTHRLLDKLKHFLKPRHHRH